jgi:hypothetical protein
MTFAINGYEDKIHNGIATIFLLPSYPGGKQTRIVCLSGGSDDHCSTPPGFFAIF